MATVLETIGIWLLGLLRWATAKIERKVDRQQQQRTLDQAQAYREQERQEKRRREIRVELIQYRELIKETVGGWHPTDPSEWNERRREVQARWRRVVNAMDLDRRSAGWAWCTAVEECLFAGWKLFSQYWALGTGMIPRAPEGANLALDRFEERQQEFDAAYEKVL